MLILLRRMKTAPFKSEFDSGISTSSLPVLFMAKRDGTGKIIEADAFNPGVVNMQVVNSGQHYLFIGQPLGPRQIPGDDSTDIFYEKIKSQLTLYGCTPVFVDTWNEYHIKQGNSHCGTNRRMLPSSDYKTWWDHIEE